MIRRPTLLRLFVVCSLAISTSAAAGEAQPGETPAIEAAPAQLPGFEVPRDQVVAHIRRIAVMPVVMPATVRPTADERDQIARRFEAAASAMLQAGGFEVIGADEMRAIRKRSGETLGALYDPHSGKADDTKLKALREFSDSEFDANHAVDGYLRILILGELAFAEGAWANWDGSRQMAYGAEKPPLGVSLDRIPVPLTALSLAVGLEDRSRKVVYGRLRGLQLTQLLRFMRGRGYSGVPLDASVWLADPERERLVLDSVLGPLATGTMPPAGALQLPREPPQPDLTAPKYISADELFRQYQRIGLVPAQFAADGERAKAARRYQGLIADQLRKYGYEVVVDEEIGRAWEEARNAAGGFHDPMTGALDRARWQTARDGVIADFRKRNDVDAVIIPEFEPTFAPIEGGWARWDGSKEMVLVMGKGLGRILNFDTVLAGSLPALSLVLHVVNDECNELVVGRGGVHVLAKIDKGRIVDVPDSDLFTDPAKDANAVTAATRDLRPKSKPAASR